MTLSAAHRRDTQRSLITVAATGTALQARNRSSRTAGCIRETRWRCSSRPASHLPRAVAGARASPRSPWRPPGRQRPPRDGRCWRPGGRRWRPSGRRWWLPLDAAAGVPCGDRHRRVVVAFPRRRSYCDGCTRLRPRLTRRRPPSAATVEASSPSVCGSALRVVVPLGGRGWLVDVIWWLRVVRLFPPLAAA